MLWIQPDFVCSGFSPTSEEAVSPTSIGFEGAIERRGEGLLVETHEARVVIRLVVDLGDPPSRWPADDDHAELLGIRLPRLALDSTKGPLDGAYAALRRLAKFP